VAAWNRLSSSCAAALILVVVGCGARADSPGLPESSGLGDLPVGWTPLPAPPEIRSRAATAWTGEKALVWGGYEFRGDGEEMAEANGFAFDASCRTWQPIADSPLAPRAFPASAWTGEELLVWGGADARQERFFGDGAAYDPETGTWRTLPEPPIGARAPLGLLERHRGI
jgi:hypothetical protein